MGQDGTTTTTLQAEVMRGLRNFLNKDRPEHHSIDHLKETGDMAAVTRSDYRKDPRTTRTALVLFEGQPRGDSCEARRRACGSFPTLPSHPERKMGGRGAGAGGQDSSLVVG